MKKDCWWGENAKKAKDTASLETPAAPALSWILSCLQGLRTCDEGWLVE